VRLLRRLSYVKRAITIAHELRGRIRLRSRIIGDRYLDPDYLETGLEAISGVMTVRTNTRAWSVVVHYDGMNATRNAILAFIATFPNKASAGQGEVRTLQSPLSLMFRASLALSLLFLPRFLGAPLAILYSIPVVAEGFATLWTRGVKVEVLDASAVLFCLFRRDYFTSASIVFLLSAGEYLEELSENRTTGLLKSLLKPKVEKIWIEEDGREIEISIEQARIGDRVICGPGELIPLDGVVVAGEASANTSSITGESVPTHLQIGTEVLSGSVVENGRIVFEARQVGSQTSMARVAGRPGKNSSCRP